MKDNAPGLTGSTCLLAQHASVRAPLQRKNNSIYILFKSTFIMKNLVTMVMALCCSIGFAIAQQNNPLSSTGYSTEAPLGYWLELETFTVHEGGALDGQTTYRVYLNTLN